MNTHWFLVFLMLSAGFYLIWVLPSLKNRRLNPPWLKTPKKVRAQLGEWIELQQQEGRLPEKLTLLEIGCGPTPILSDLKNIRLSHYIGVEIHPIYCFYLRHFFSPKQFLEKMTFLQADALKFDYNALYSKHPYQLILLYMLPDFCEKITSSLEQVHPTEPITILSVDFPLRLPHGKVHPTSSPWHTIYEYQVNTPG